MNDQTFGAHPLRFFRDCVELLFGKRLSEVGLETGAFDLDGRIDVNILGPIPTFFDEVCLSKWRQIGDHGRHQVMDSPIQYYWDASEHGGCISLIPGLGAAIDLIVDCVPPVNEPVSPAKPPASCLLEIDHRAPYGIARQLVATDWTWWTTDSDDTWPTLIHMCGEFFSWDWRRYVVLPADALRSELYERLNDAVSAEDGQPFNPDATKITKVMDALRAATHKEGDSGSSFWLDGNDDAPVNLISIQNGVLDPVTRKLHEHSPKFFTRNTIPVVYDKDHGMVPQEWFKFLNECWPGELDSQRLLKQMFGAALLGRNFHHKICLLVGPPRSGKGTIMRVLTALIGAENVAGPTLGDFATQFGLAPLIGKRIAIVGDARFAGRPDQMAQAVSKLLSISGGDMLTLDRKHREPWVGRLDMQLFICSNELPRLTDASGALASRFLVLQMTRSHLGREDKGLESRLLEELPGILVWALDGLADLIKSGHFVEPKASSATVADLVALGSPIFDFVEQCCELGDGCTVRCDELYRLWLSFHKDQGYGQSGSLQTFARDLRSAFPGVVTHQVRAGIDRGKRVFVGIKLRRPLLN